MRPFRRRRAPRPPRPALARPSPSGCRPKPGRARGRRLLRARARAPAARARFSRRPGRRCGPTRQPRSAGRARAARRSPWRGRSRRGAAALPPRRGRRLPGSLALPCSHVTLLTRDLGRTLTRMADERDLAALRRDRLAAERARGVGLPPRPLHPVGAGGDGPPLAGGAPARQGAAVPGDQQADARVDDDGDAGGALAAVRRGRLPLAARPQAAAADDRLTIALPAKGRLREPAISLLGDAGLGPEEPGERALAFPCRNAPVDVLLVRAADVPEYVQDGVVDCGITGADLVRERGARVLELLRLGFGACTLEAAVPEESPISELADLSGASVATAYPRLAREVLLERGLQCELVDVTGSVEVAPRLGLADAIVDLVSSGSTLRTNGLRSLGALYASEAVLIAREKSEHATRLAAILRSVVEARQNRYLMLNAPRDSLDAIFALVPGSRAPSVLPLAEEGMVAVHALVPAADVWRLLPKLEAAGASSILLVPVERMIA